MDDRTQTSRRLFGETPPEFRAAGGDLRIDVYRGIALWRIFLDHVPNNIGSWLTPRNYGFCDAAEIFMFLSGVTCALAYGRVREREGWSGMIGRSLRRGWDIYAAFLLLTLACAILVYLTGSDDLADGSNTRILLERPGATLAHAAILQYRPVNTDVLPVFVIFHVLFAPLLWLLLRAQNVTLGVSLSLYALVHVFDWSVPAWPNGVWFFNPLAWQFLIVLGAWCVIEGEKFRPWVMARLTLILAVSLSSFRPGSCSELEDRAAGLANFEGPAISTGQIESQSDTAAAFCRSCNCGATIHSAELGGAIDAGAELREVLWREFAADLLFRRPSGARQPSCAARPLEGPCDADRSQCCRSADDDRHRAVTERDGHPARAEVSGDAIDRASSAGSLNW